MKKLIKAAVFSRVIALLMGTVASTATIAQAVLGLQDRSFVISQAPGGAGGRDGAGQRNGHVIRCREPDLSQMQVALLTDFMRGTTGRVGRAAKSEIKTDHSLSGLFNISLPLIAKQKELLARWLSTEGTTEDFWKNLGHGSNIPRRELHQFRLTLFLAKLMDYDLPLLLHLKEVREAKRLVTLVDISRLSRSTWKDIVTESGSTRAPEDFIRKIEKFLRRNNMANCG